MSNSEQYLSVIFANFNLFFVRLAMSGSERKPRKYVHSIVRVEYAFLTTKLIKKYIFLVFFFTDFKKSLETPSKTNFPGIKLSFK